jgi:O-acetyl-ADP-ribose deacetylase (regulator of RNase III)
MRVSTELGDITKVAVDAVVNAANSSLLGGGGVDGAIHQAAGPRLLAACRKLRSTTYPDGLPVGHAVATPGFDLPASWVIHTVGPNFHRGETDPALLASCFTSSLAAADELGATTVAFPAVSAGVYGWDAHDVARIATAAVRHWTAGHPASNVSEVRFVLYNERLLETFREAQRD